MIRVLICLLSSLCILPSSFSAPPNLLITTREIEVNFAGPVGTIIKDLLQLIQTKLAQVK